MTGVADNGIQRLPITLPWPSVPARVPKVWTGPVETTDEMLFVSTDPETIREVALPRGLYLGELDKLDLESPRKIGEFVEKYGNPGSFLWKLRPTWDELQAAWRKFLEDEHEELVPRDLPPIDRRLAEVETALSEALAEVAAASLLAERAGNDDALRRLAAAEKRRDKLAAEREKADRDGTERTAKQISAHPRTIAYGLAEFAERARLGTTSRACIGIDAQRRRATA